MQLPPMLHSVHQRHLEEQAEQQRRRFGGQSEEEEEEKEQRSLSDVGYDMIDNIGSNFRKMAPYLNKTIEYAWVPVVIYYGLKQGSHKFYPTDQSNLPPELQDMQCERKPSWTDTIPLFGSHGSQHSGILPNN